MEHDVIYLQPACCVGEDGDRQWCSDPFVWDCEESGKPVAYVRMDLAIKHGYVPNAEDVPCTPINWLAGENI